MQVQGLSNFAAIARSQAANNPAMPYFKEYEKEIDKLVANVPLAQRADPACYTTAYNMVIGMHHNEIMAKEREKILRESGGSVDGSVPSTQRRDSSRTATALCLPSRSSGTLTSLATSLTASSSRRSSRPLTSSTASSTQSGPTNAYVCGNTMTSMDAARSSSVTMAQAPPALVTLRCTAVTRPPRSVSGLGTMVSDGQPDKRA